MTQYTKHLTLNIQYTEHLDNDSVNNTLQIQIPVFPRVSNLTYLEIYFLWGLTELQTMYIEMWMKGIGGPLNPKVGVDWVGLWQF